ncbi:hypothetical protein Ancab_009830 [Ancistrocladus abbreviatus]
MLNYSPSSRSIIILSFLLFAKFLVDTLGVMSSPESAKSSQLWRNCPWPATSGKSLSFPLPRPGVPLSGVKLGLLGPLAPAVLVSAAPHPISCPLIPDQDKKIEFVIKDLGP